MSPTPASPVRAAVVAGDGDRQERLAERLGEDGAVSVETVEAVEQALDTVQDGDTDCVVVVTGEDYRRLRERTGTTPVVVVAGDLARDVLERVVRDDSAKHLPPAGDVGAALEARVEAVAAADVTAWELADFTDDAVVAFDTDSFGVVEANEAFFETWGWERDRLSGATLSDLRETDITYELRGQGRGDVSEETMEWIREDDPVGSLVDRAVGGRYEVREWHCQRADGDPFKSEVRVVADDHGGRGYLVATVPDDVDGDEPAAAGDTDAGYDEASMLQSVMEHVPMSVYFEDRMGRHVLVSEDLVEPFIEGTDGKIMHTPEDVQGKTYFDLYTEDMATRATSDNERIMETGEPLRNQEKHVQPPQGRDLFFSTNKAPWYDDDGRVQGIVGITLDITQQKRRERELDRQNARLEEFASIVSHDLRNPLNVADGRLELYRETGDEEHLSVVSEMHERMDSLIADVLTFAREGSRVEDPVWLDGADRVAETWRAVDTADATLTQDWAHRIRADPDRLDRLFANLFRNAVEHAGSDVRVEVGTLSDESGFYVADDGPGIPEADREDVFDRGMTTRDQGTGFGLAIVRELAEAHGWEVTATESDTGGARLEFHGVARASGSGE